MNVLGRLETQIKTQYIAGGLFLRIIDPVGHLLFYDFCKILFCMLFYIIIVQYENGFKTISIADL